LFLPPNVIMESSYTNTTGNPRVSTPRVDIFGTHILSYLDRLWPVANSCQASTEWMPEGVKTSACWASAFSPGKTDHPAPATLGIR
jgi:hypothetical protein